VHPVRPVDALRLIGLALDMAGYGEYEPEMQGFVGERLTIIGSTRFAIGPCDAA